MGIGEWLFGGREEQAPVTPIPRVPTADDLLAAVDRVEAMAVAGKVRPEVLARLRRVTKTVRETIPRMDRLGGGSTQAYHVMATATDYLPEAIGGYLRLPREGADSRPVDRGKTPLMILVDQLDLLGRTMDRVFDAINHADAEALVIHGRRADPRVRDAAADDAHHADHAAGSDAHCDSDAHGTDAPCDADARHRHPTSPVATPHRKAGLDEPAA